MKKKTPRERQRLWRERWETKDAGHSPAYKRERGKPNLNEHDKNQTQMPTEPDMELHKISKEVLVYEMMKANFTDLDIKEQTGLSWDEIKRLKAGGKREYQRLIDEHIKEIGWVIWQKGYEAAENEQ